MKIFNFKKLIAFVFLFSFTLSSALIAQDKKKTDEPKLNPDGSYSSTKYNEAERPEDSYLAKFHARDVVEKLMKTNLEQIYLLKVIVSNFKDQNWKADYDKVYAGYKKATELFYKRNLIYSRVEYENNRKAISDLMKKMTTAYEKDTQTMLNICATQILQLHLNASVRSDPNKNTDLFNNQMRLRIAYGQFDDAIAAMVDKKYETALYHFRVSKSYAIKILEDIAPTDKKQGIKDKYKFHKADNLNRIFEKQKESSSSTSSTNNTK